jgi:hypothetical protein
MCDELGENCAEAGLRHSGQDLYHWVEAEARYPFRTITSRFLNVGSYHILANVLKVGWHRDFETLHANDGSGGPDGS